MLRIERHEDGSTRVTLKIEGSIVAEWVEVLEHECVELLRAGRVVHLDLAGVTFIGWAGLKLLARLVRMGVEVGDCTPLIAEVLEQEGIRLGPPPSDPRERRGNGERSHGR